MSILQKSFYLRSPEVVARELLGKELVYKSPVGTVSGIICETEAYLAEDDPASHSAPGHTKRNSAMFEEGGILYVYKIYGIHHCINVVTEVKDRGSAVLIRAIEPKQGIDIMKKNREIEDIYRICKGPGNVAKAFGFDLNNNDADLNSGDLYLREGNDISDNEIALSERIGISKAKNMKLRYFIFNSKYISGKKNSHNS